MFIVLCMNNKKQDCNYNLESSIFYSLSINTSSWHLIICITFQWPGTAKFTTENSGFGAGKWIQWWAHLSTSTMCSMGTFMGIYCVPVFNLLKLLLIYRFYSKMPMQKKQYSYISQGISHETLTDILLPSNLLLDFCDFINCYISLFQFYIKSSFTNFLIREIVCLFYLAHHCTCHFQSLFFAICLLVSIICWSWILSAFYLLQALKDKKITQMRRGIAHNKHMVPYLPQSQGFSFN